MVIRANKDEAFRWCCKNGYIEVAQWLQTLCDDYKIEIINNKITKYWIGDIMEELIKNIDFIIETKNDIQL